MEVDVRSDHRFPTDNRKNLEMEMVAESDGTDTRMVQEAQEGLGDQEVLAYIE